MKTVSLSGSIRENVGKKDATLLRREGKIPSVLYGGKEQVHFHISENDAKKIVFTPNVYVIELEINGNKVNAILKDVQIHPVTDKVVHIDFLEVKDGAAVKIKIPIKTTGFSIGVRNGGKLRKTLRKLSIRSTPENLPDNITIDITPMTIGEKVYVKDLEAANFDILTAGSSVIVAVKTARGVIDEEEEEAPEAEAEAPAAE